MVEITFFLCKRSPPPRPGGLPCTATECGSRAETSDEAGVPEGIEATTLRVRFRLTANNVVEKLDVEDARRVSQQAGHLDVS